MKERGLAEEEEEGQREITDEGTEWLESGVGKVKGKKGKGEISETGPSRSDLFRALGERLSITVAEEREKGERERKGKRN